MGFWDVFSQTNDVRLENILSWNCMEHSGAADGVALLSFSSGLPLGGSFAVHHLHGAIT